MVLKVDAIDAKRNNHEVVEKYSSKLEKISVFSDLSQKAVNTEEIMKEILNYTQDNNDDERRLKISKHNAEMFRRDGDIKSAEEIETRIKNGQEKLKIEERIKSAGIETIKQYQIGEKDYDHTTDKTLTESQRMLKDDLDKKRCEISLKIERYKDKVKSTRESYARYRTGIPYKYNQSNEEMQAGMIEQKRLNREYTEKVEKMETELELIDLLYNMDLNSFLNGKKVKEDNTPNSESPVISENILEEILPKPENDAFSERVLKSNLNNAFLHRQNGDIKSAEEIETRIKNGQEKLKIEERIKSAGIETIKQYQIGEKDYDHTTDKTLTESQRMLKDDLDKKRCEISLKIERYRDKVKSTRESYARYRTGIPYKYNQSNEEMQAGMIEQKRLNREYTEKVEKMETELELIDLLYNMDLNSFLSI